MLIKLYLVAAMVGVLVFSLGCKEKNNQSNKEVSGAHCFAFVDTYLSFHQFMTAKHSSDKLPELLETLHVHPEDEKKAESLQTLVSLYSEHENEIIDISEYHARCAPERGYAVMWFKISDLNPKFSRLYVVITDGKIRTLSKELNSSSDDIDYGKDYIVIKNYKTQSAPRQISSKSE